MLESWVIPDAILAEAAGNSPWELDPNLFLANKPQAAGTPGLATRRALDALPVNGSVLDVGCGGGAAGLALATDADLIVGVDESAGMLDSFAMSATERGVAHRVVHGRWPDVAGRVESADVVVCHHVAYNVPDLDDFVRALSEAARCRVVLELTATHPQTRNRGLWDHFWGLDRPTGPTSTDALAVITEAGIAATLEHDTQINTQRATPDPMAQARQMARMCCLAPDRLDEVVAFLAAHPPLRTPPDVIWWDA